MNVKGVLNACLRKRIVKRSVEGVLKGVLRSVKGVLEEC
jgi:hypothetical protein